MTSSNPENLAQRIRAAMASRGFDSALELSDASGINPGTLSRLLAGKIKNPHQNTLRALAAALEIEVSQLTEARLYKQSRPAISDPDASKISHRNPHMLPTMNTEGELNHNQLVASFIPLGSSGFVWLVTGDSMTAPGETNYPHNCWVICSMSEQAKPGTRVVVNVEGTILMKELIEDMGELRLRSLNPRYERQVVISPRQILGVVVGKMEYERI